MADLGYPATRHDHADDAAESKRVDEATQPGPVGAVAVSGIAVGLLLVCWLLIYFFVFLPRGTVG